MDMTFDDYIQNPMGRENAVISNRNMYRDLYKAKLDKILVRENGKIEYHCYSIGTKYMCYLKIPSEVVPKFYYDVLIEFSPSKKLVGSGSLKDYNVRFFSNDPSFVFTFAHAFLKNGLFINNFSDKMSEKAIKEVAKEKNPKNQVGYVKSLYFAYLIMQSRGLFSKLKYVDPYSEVMVKRSIMPADKKIKERQEQGQALSKKNTTERRKQAKELSDNRNNLEKEIPIVKKAMNTKIGKVGKVASGVKSINKIKRK